MIKHTHARFLPRKVIMPHPAGGEDRDGIEQVAPLIKNQNPIGDKPTAYVCENHVCKLPVNTPSSFLDILDKLK